MAEQVKRFMTVRQLMQQLKSFHPDLRVVIDGYEGGYHDVTPKQVHTKKVVLNVHNPKTFRDKNGDWLENRYDSPLVRDETVCLIARPVDNKLELSSPDYFGPHDDIDNIHTKGKNKRGKGIKHIWEKSQELHEQLTKKS